VEGTFIEIETLALLRSIDARLKSLEATDSLILGTLAEFLSQWEQANIEQPSAATATLTIGGNMALTVDTTTGNGVLSFEDDKGDVTGPPPGDGSGLVVAFSSDNEAVATVGTAVAGTDASGNGNFSAPITPLTEGSFNLSAVVSNTSGAALTDADGTTAFVQPTALSVPVAAGQAASGSLSVTS
jgi:hypothetical protein